MPLVIASDPLSEKKQVQEWDKSFEELVETIRPRFARVEAHERARSYLQGLLSPIARKNSWQLAEEAGDSNPYGIQNLLGRAVWEADQVRDDLIGYVKEHLSTTAGVGVFDETGFIKKGTQSVGVQRQYSGTAGKVENCQVGVFLSYVSEKGHTFVDRELYLPASWIGHPDRRRRAGVPEEIEFATKPALAQQMLERATAANMTFAWITGDTVYGNNPDLREFLEEQHQAYVLGVASTETVVFNARPMMASDVCEQLAGENWERLSAGNGAKGPRIYDWALVELDEVSAQGCSKWLLLRRNIKDPQEVAYYRVFAITECTLAEVVRVAGCRWTIEECFETAKGEVGLDQYEVRSWTGWYRHITLSCLAHAFLSVMRSKAVLTGSKKIAMTMNRTALKSSLAAFKRQRGL